MSTVHDDFPAIDHEDPEREATTSVSLFEGDEGGLEYAERRALVALLKQRFISARTHPRDWRALTENERVIRARLNDLFLELQIDPVREVAWKRQAVSETGQKFPTLLYDAACRRLRATDGAGDEKRARNAVSNVNRAGLLIGAPSDDRFESSEAIEPLLPLELLKELLVSLQRTNDPEAAPEDDPLFGDEPARRRTARPDAAQAQ